MVEIKESGGVVVSQAYSIVVVSRPLASSHHHHIAVPTFSAHVSASFDLSVA